MEDTEKTLPENSNAIASLGPVSRKPRRLFGPEKPLVKLRPTHSVKLAFSYVVKGIKSTITAKFHASRRLRFENTNRNMSPEMRLKSFGTFEKRAPGFAGSTCKTEKTNLQKLQNKLYLLLINKSQFR